MELLDTELAPSPLSRKRVRLSGRVRYATGEPRQETLWFEAPRELAEEVSRTGDPWIVVLLPLAATLGEELIVPLAVDPVLLEGCRAVLKVWKGWYPHLSVPELNVTVRDGEDRDPPDRSAALFSGGVDSFHTLMRHEPEPTPGVPPLADLLTVWGLDVPLANVAEAAKLEAWASRVASGAGKRSVFMASNVRETRWSQTDWSRVSHGALLVACGLTLQGRYRALLVPSSVPYVRSRRRWGSHLLTDALLSTRATSVVHDGAQALRTEKTARIARSPLAMRHLRVCWVEGATANCGRCAKCLRTMATLEAVGALSGCEAFPVEGLDLEALASVPFATGSERRMLERVLPLAAEHGRSDIVDAIEMASRRGRRLEAVEDVLWKLGRLGVPERVRERFREMIARWIRG